MDKASTLYIDFTKRIRQGDETAFEHLFKLYYQQLVGFARVYVKQTDISEEIVQETFIKIWEIRSSLDETQSLKAFLYRCVHNNCINYVKKTENLQRLKVEYAREITSRIQIIQEETGDNYFDLMALNDLEIKVQETIDKLPSQCREVFILCRLKGLSYQQISQHLNISVNTVKTHLLRAMNRLRSKFENYP